MQGDLDELDAQAQEALDAARRLPHGPKRSEAMKKAGQLRLVADARRARMNPSANKPDQKTLPL